MPEPCVFCEIVEGRSPATIVHRWPDAVAILPLNPVVEGHLLVIPNRHVRDVAEDASVSAVTMAAASELAAAAWPCNIITSAGAEATQTVFHLHLHVVPRREHDGLALPWTPEARTPARRPRIACPVCGREVVKRDDGKPTTHYPINHNPKFTCDGTLYSRCRGGCKCKKHR